MLLANRPSPPQPDRGEEPLVTGVTTAREGASLLLYCCPGQLPVPRQEARASAGNKRSPNV